MAATATLIHDTLLPRAPGGLAPGAALALLAHAGLLLALTYATDWRTQAPEVVSAELWAAVPQVAAPRPEPAPAPPPAPEPAPPPPVPAPVKAEPPPRPDADIATERAEKRKAELEQKRRADEARKARELKAQAQAQSQAQAQAQAQRQAEAIRQKEAEAERAVKAEQKRRDTARELLAEEARLAEQRAENLRRMMGQTGPSGTGSATSRGAAATDAAPSAAYSGRLAALIRANTVFTGNAPDNAVAEVEVRAAASGQVLSRRLVKSSGHADWDEAVLRAIDRTSRLPRDTDGRVPPVIIIAFKPRE